MNTARQAQITSGLLGVTGIVLAAIGKHMLAGPAQPAAEDAWQSAISMHLFHAIALLALSASLGRGAGGYLRLAGWCWLGGVVLFSGSVYLKAGVGIHVPGPIAPLGGFALILGWAALAVAAFRASG